MRVLFVVVDGGGCEKNERNGLMLWRHMYDGWRGSGVACSGAADVDAIWRYASAIRERDPIGRRME